VFILYLHECRLDKKERQLIAYRCQLFAYGAGGTFALYSLLCRHARLSILPNQQATDEKLFAYATDGLTDTWQSSALVALFEKHPRLRKVLLIFVLLGTCMAIGDGVLTPPISGSS
jgi:KUP system potassium uptake protein